MNNLRVSTIVSLELHKGKKKEKKKASSQSNWRERDHHKQQTTIPNDYNQKLLKPSKKTTKMHQVEQQR
jgi:hypothetical protein